MGKPNQKELRNIKKDFEKVLVSCIKAGESGVKLVDSTVHGDWAITQRMRFSTIITWTQRAAVCYERLSNNMTKTKAIQQETKVEKGGMNMAGKKKSQETPTKASVEPRHIGNLLAFLAGMWCSVAAEHRKKPKEMQEYMETTLCLGFLLARRYPELADACYQYFQYTRGENPDEFVDESISLYHKWGQEAEDGE